MDCERTDNFLLYVTYGFRDNLLLWLSNLERNPAVTQKEMACHRDKQWEKAIITECFDCHQLLDGCLEAYSGLKVNKHPLQITATDNAVNSSSGASKSKSWPLFSRHH